VRGTIIIIIIIIIIGYGIDNRYVSNEQHAWMLVSID
jgi:hypothetical protein